MRSPRSLHRTTARSSRSASAAASARPWLLSSVFAVCVSACVVLLAAPLLGLFLQPGETEILQAGVTYLRIAGAFYVGIGGLFLLYGLYRAVGRPGMSLVLTVISLGTRVALAYALSAVPAIGVVGIWWSIPIAGRLRISRACSSGGAPGES